MMTEKYYVKDVFTPTKPARATFVERDLINDRLVEALQTPGKQVIVYGHSGCGKTTFLVNKLDQIFESYIVTRCTQNLKFEHLILHAFDELDSFYTSEISYKKQQERSAALLSQFERKTLDLKSNVST